MKSNALRVFRDVENSRRSVFLDMINGDCYYCEVGCFPKTHNFDAYSVLLPMIKTLWVEEREPQIGDTLSPAMKAKLYNKGKAR